jgi:hypothetical protein
VGATASYRCASRQNTEFSCSSDVLALRCGSVSRMAKKAATVLVVCVLRGACGTRPPPPLLECCPLILTFITYVGRGNIKEKVAWVVLLGTSVADTTKILRSLSSVTHVAIMWIVARGIKLWAHRTHRGALCNTSSLLLTLTLGLPGKHTVHSLRS